MSRFISQQNKVTNKGHAKMAPNQTPEILPRGLQLMCFPGGPSGISPIHFGERAILDIFDRPIPVSVGNSLPANLLPFLGDKVLNAVGSAFHCIVGTFALLQGNGVTYALRDVHLDESSRTAFQEAHRTKKK